MVKKLMKSIREYKTSTILTPIFVALEVVLEVVIPFLMKDLIDKGIDVSNFENVLIYGALLLVCALFSLTFGALSGVFSAISSSGFGKNLRKDLFYKVQNFSFYNIDKFSTSSIITRMTTDVTNVQNAFQMLTRIAIRSPLMLTFALIMAFISNKDIAIILLIAVPILGIALYFIMTSVHPIFKRAFKKYDRLNTIVQENLRGIRVVKAYVREDYETKKFKNASKDIYDDFLKAEKIIALNSPLMQFIVFACMIAISWFGATLIINSHGTLMSKGELMSMFTYTMQVLMSLMMFSMVLVMITISRNSAERIVEVLDEESDIRNPYKPVMTVADGSIVFKNVSFSYAKDNDKLCLNNINLNINNGQTVGIIGGTGSSKSTLISLIPRLYDVTNGKILVGGKNVKEYDIKVLRDQVGIVLQKNVLFSGTIKENLRWGNEQATDEELIEACKIAQANDFIEQFPNKYDTYIEQGGTNVSGGQKQRLCIARALLKKPKILILDDSTSAVDTATDAKIRDAFINKLPKMTKIIIAQRVASIQDADKIVVMDGGTIKEVGTHQELLEKSEIYREVYTSQVKDGGDNE